MSVYEVGGFGSEEYRRTCQIFRSSPTGSRSFGNDELVERMARTVGLDLAQRRSLRSSDVARADAVALDVVFAVLRSNVAGQHLQSASGCCVSRNRLASQLAHQIGRAHV